MPQHIRCHKWGKTLGMAIPRALQRELRITKGQYLLVRRGAGDYFIVAPLPLDNGHPLERRERTPPADPPA